MYFCDQLLSHNSLQIIPLLWSSLYSTRGGIKKWIKNSWFHWGEVILLFYMLVWPDPPPSGESESKGYRMKTSTNTKVLKKVCHNFLSPLWPHCQPQTTSMVCLSLIQRSNMVKMLNGNQKCQMEDLEISNIHTKYQRSVPLCGIRLPHSAPRVSTVLFSWMSSAGCFQCTAAWWASCHLL